MALCSSSHCGLTECDFGPVFLCITSTVSKKGMAKGQRERKGKPSGWKRQTQTCHRNTFVRFPQQASGRDNAVQDGRTKTLSPRPESGRLMSPQAWGTLVHEITGGVSGKRASSAVITRFIAPDVANSIGDYKVV